MQEINTSVGVFRFKEIPLYTGRKYIEKDISLRNLLLFRELMESEGISFSLAFGTLLGAIREKDFISHDEDIDLIILDEERNKFLDTLFKLKELGFQVARYDSRGLLSIIKDNEYIDLYFFSSYNEKYRYCCGIIIPKYFLDDLIWFDFKGMKFQIIRKYEEYLKFEYGKNWKVPIEYYPPSLKNKILGHFRVIIKSIAPTWLKKRLTENSEKDMVIAYEDRIKLFETDSDKC